MPDIVRTDAEILALLADNGMKQIKAQQVRDAYVSLLDRIEKAAQPDAFTFTDVTNAPLGVNHNHADITLTGMKVPGLARATGGLIFSVNGGAFVTEAVVQNDDVLSVRMRSSSDKLTGVQGSLSVSGVSDTWSITTGNFWTPFDDPEMVAWAFMQEDLDEGPVTSWTSRGLKPKTATGTATKLANEAGVKFSAGTTNNLKWATDTDVPLTHRGWAAIARSDFAGSSDIPVLCVHQLTGIGSSAGSQPVIRFRPDLSPEQMAWFIRNDAGTLITFTANADTNVDNWNVLRGTHRSWRMFGRINGTDLSGVEVLAQRPNNVNSESWMGAGTASPGSVSLPGDMIIDCVIMLMGQPNDAWLDKLDGWLHWRAGREDLLPAGHPYKASAPLADGSEGTPAKFSFVQADWDTWAAISTATKTVNQGNAPPALDDGSGDDYRIVFRDDFVANTIVDYWSGAPSSIWYAPMWNTAVGGDAAVQRPSQSPSCYIHDDVNHTMKLRLQETVPSNETWVTGAFTTINQSGKGRHWFTKGRFRVRCRFPMLAAPRPGFFPGMPWFYGKEHLFFRSRNRLEFDVAEYDGLNGEFINNGTMHIHPPTLASNIEGILQSSVSDEIFGGELDPPEFDPAIDIYADNAYHIWEARIEDDFTYLIVDDKEVARAPTTAWLLVPKYMNFTWAYRAFENEATPGQTYDMEIDWVEVQMRERWLDDVPTGFSARPTLSGTRGSGNTITVTPNVTASQIEYRWYKDGEPIVGQEAATFVEDADSATKALSVTVQAVSLLNQPIAWTAELAP